MRAELILNPRSRRGSQLGGAVRRTLQLANVEIVEPGGAQTIDAIVVAGGDGTMVRQIPRALALGVPIGLVPLGTFNDLARTLGVPLDMETACKVIAAARTRTIDVARVNDAYYVTEASIGVSSRLARRQRPEEKQRFGLFIIAAGLLEAAKYARPFHAEISYDGERARVRAIQLTVGNSQRFGGFITVDEAAIDDGRLECYAVAIDNVRDFFSVAAAIVLRRRLTPGLRIFHATAFDVWTRRRHYIAADGEPAGTTPARFEVLPKALRVFVP